MTRLLPVLLLLISTSALAGPKSEDIRIDDDRARSPAARLAHAEDAAAEMRGAMDDLAGWYGLALFEGQVERVRCLDGKEHVVRALLGSTEDAVRDLRPSVLNGFEAVAERESRQIRIALERARRLHTQGAKCAAMVNEPIEPRAAGMELPPESDDLSVMTVDVFDSFGGASPAL